MKKKISILLVSLLLFTGCAKIRDWWQTTKGSLVGLAFNITVYDNYGNRTVGMYGKNVDIEVFSDDSSWFNDSETESEFPSEVIEITIDRNQVLQVGNTVIFAEEGLDKVEDFELKDMNGDDGMLNWIPFDRYINDIKNQIGKSKTVVIMSQMGVPIEVYQGDSVYVTIPENLPKMTRLNIDGKSLYLHRCNYLILDTKLMN